MRVIIVSGLSGSGKTIALQTLEDLDYYCVDNLPLNLILPLAREILAASDILPPTVAVGVDARNFIDELHRFPAMLAELRASDLSVEVLFLQADDEILLKRYSETRRRHPLDLGSVPLREAIRQERNLLEPVVACADLIVDTSDTTSTSCASCSALACTIPRARRCHCCSSPSVLKTGYQRTLISSLTFAACLTHTGSRSCDR